MPYREPTSMEEYTRRFSVNAEVTGFGADVTQHFPCPFCAAPGFMQIKPMELAMKDEATFEATCKHCGRSGRMPFKRGSLGSSMQFEQTGGPDPPPWLQPPPPDARQSSNQSSGGSS